MSNKNELEVSLPGEWVLKKTLGPVLGELGEDMKKLYAVGRDKILLAAYNKVSNKEDGKEVNLRVARDVFWNGSFTDETICAEYFGGILASSRSNDGKDDNGIHYTDVIKSLSSKQLELHYIVYNSFNKLLIQKNKQINVGLDTELQKESIWFSMNELLTTLKNVDTDLNVLYKQGLLVKYQFDTHELEGGKSFPYVTVTLTTFGILLYAIAHNKFDIWQEFSTTDFGNFKDIPLPKFYASSIDELLEALGLKKSEKEE